MNIHTNVSTLPLADERTARALLFEAIGACHNLLASECWKVGCIKEFLPRSDSLLGRNTNRGELIEVRVRLSIRNPEKYVGSVF